MVRVIERKRYEVNFDASREEMNALVYILRDHAGENNFLKTLLAACSDATREEFECRPLSRMAEGTADGR